MPSSRRDSPWAYNDEELKCPKCGSERIERVLERWARARGIQIFKCNSCGSKFYDKGYDDYKPLFY
ncbi:MAG: hypothetical protein BAJATHORv1_10501 [Candidatus Thorarchaeota archaeon]|nr:MAG: hypothetical protein BAJATHORv1_10501 [Candidatus Thorarchaeota archaeon]